MVLTPLSWVLRDYLSFGVVFKVALVLDFRLPDCFFFECFMRVAVRYDDFALMI